MARRRTLAFALVLMTATAAIPVPVSAQTAPVLTVEVGVDGYVDPDSPTLVRVTMSAEQLLVGTLEVSRGSIRYASEVELPAGTTKVVDVELPAHASSNSNSISVVLRDQNGESAAAQRFTTRQAFDEVLVGVVGDGSLLAAVDGMTTSPFETDITAVSLTDADIDRPLYPLDYLVVAQQLGPDAGAVVREWVGGGGRLIGTADALAAIDLLAVPGAPLIVGQGVVEVSDLRVNDGVIEGLVIASVPVPLRAFSEGFDQLGSTLFEAASFGSRADLGFGWLAMALIIYVAIVGPVNFLVLSRLGKRDWAWVTVPTLGVIGMLVFASLGSSEGEAIRVRHATVVISDRGVTTADSGVLLVASSDGQHDLSVPGAQIVPFDASGWFGGGRSTDSRILVAPDGEQTASFDLVTLGVASVNARWEPDTPDVVLTEEQVQNSSDLTFKSWGVRTGDDVRVGSAPLAPGASAAIGNLNRSPVFNGFEAPIAEAIFSNGNFNFEDENQIWPLSWAASQINRELLTGGAYFFGFTDDLEVEVAANGQAGAASGAALVIIAMESGVSDGSSSGELLATEGAEHIESYGPTFIYGAEMVALRFLVPDGVGDLRLTSRDFPGLNGTESIEVYNFIEDAFVEIDARQPFPTSGVISPLGEVMVRLTYDNNFSEVWVEALQLEWGGS